MYRIGVDIGGTFTDFAVHDEASGEVHVAKALTTPDAPERAVIDGLAALARRLPRLAAASERIGHATTLVTNAILERKGATTALVTTAGFRDVLETRAEYRYDVYDLFIRFPEPIVPRERRFGIGERILADGSVRRPLDEAALRALAARLRADGIAAIAVCFLHAYRNPSHEQRAVEILRAAMPEAAISASHEVNPEPREYERLSTTTLDAYVKPIVDRYLRRLQSRAAEIGFAAPIDIMLSNGGSARAETARRFPIQMIESGPAAGVEAALWTCRRLGISDALSFDMGGTTAKLCVIRGGEADRARSFEAGRVHRFVAGSGLPVAVPVYDLVEIGAGGGSIARIDQLGLVAVGPDSAGAEPGPACYGRGGMQPTVTDADVALGLIDPDFFLGGDMRLSADAAHTALSHAIGAPLGVDAAAAAHGVFEIVNETMAAAARLHIAEKGCDPSRLTVIAFGGAGPIHAVALGRKLGCPRVVFPPQAGVMSSLGLLTAPPAFERVASIKRLLDDTTVGEIAAELATLRQRVTAEFGTASGLEFRYAAELWHHGQEFPIAVGFAAAELAEGLQAALQHRFRTRYRELYGRSDDATPIEIATLRVVGLRPGAPLAMALGAGVSPPTLPARRRVYDAASRRFIEVAVTYRAALRPGEAVAGPLAIQDRESGLVIGAGDRAVLHASGAVFVELAAPRGAQAA